MEETIKISVLNEILGENGHKYYVQQEIGHIGVPNDSEGNEGEYNETFKYYKHPEFPVGIFLKKTFHTDSYGSNTFLESLQFVKGKEKTVTIYEPIK